MNKLIMFVSKGDSFIRFSQKNDKYIIELNNCYTCIYDSYEKARKHFETFLKNF